MNELLFHWQWLIAAMSAFTLLGFGWLLWQLFTGEGTGGSGLRKKHKENHA